jgi:hypothetical protein
MRFLVGLNWKKLNKTVWTRLEKRKSAPPDMYIELLRFAKRRMGIGIDVATYEALGDPKLAREEFYRLPEPQNEPKCIELLEGFYSVLQEFKPGIAATYQKELKKFIEERNLRYLVSDDCKLRLSVQGLLVSQYTKLRNRLMGSPDAEQCLRQLETSVSRLKDGMGEERNCIGIATNLLEGIACNRTTNRQNTLGRAIDGCDVFPHESLRTCVKDLYRFASDYPNIRHAGTPANRIRELKKDDALLATALALAFSSYVLDNDSADAVIHGEL